MVELAFVSTPDQDTIVRAIEDARRILGQYVEPGPRDNSGDRATPAGRARQGRRRSRSRSNKTAKSGAPSRVIRVTCAPHADEAQSVAASLIA